jgi:hypothetical protein
VQADSDAVWAQVSAAAGSRAGGFPAWRTARIAVEARDDGPWTARAVKLDGSLGVPHAFTPL